MEIKQLIKTPFKLVYHNIVLSVTWPTCNTRLFKCTRLLQILYSNVYFLREYESCENKNVLKINKSSGKMKIDINDKTYLVFYTSHFDLAYDR